MAMNGEVRQLVASVLEIPAEQVTAELSFNAIPQWDSLNHVNLMLALEGLLNTEVDADLMIELTSVSAIEAFVAQRQTNAA
jgi:citrate synthase